MLLSVVMPVSNTGIDMKHAILSVCVAMDEQTEFIIVVNGGALHVIDKVRNLVNKIPRVKMIIAETATCQNMSQALNIGIKSALGEWIIRMDDDDLMHSERIRRTREAINSVPNHAFLIGGLIKTFQKSSSNENIIVSNNTLHNQRNLALSNVDKSILLMTTPFVHPAICFRKICYPYDTRYQYAQDLKFYIDNIDQGSFWIDNRCYLYYQISKCNSYKRRYQLAFHDRAINSLHKRLVPRFSLMESHCIRSLFITDEYSEIKTIDKQDQYLLNNYRKILQDMRGKLAEQIDN